MAVTFDIRFDGLDADYHQIDMRDLGRSLVGLERMVGDAVFLATEGRLPKPRERRSLVVRVEAPHAACFELKGIVESAQGILPIAIEIIRDPGTRFIFNFLSFLLKFKGGKPKEADQHLMEAHRLLIEDRKDERRHHFEDVDKWRRYSLDLADRLTGAVRDAVTPVGGSTETLSLPGPAGEPATVIDVPMAEAVRSKQALEVGDMTRMRIRVDGVIKHNRQLKVEMEGAPGRYVNAEVRDPAFDTSPNVYTRAVAEEGFLEVDAKPTYRDGELIKLHIMNAA